MPTTLLQGPDPDPLTSLAALPTRRRNLILAYVNTLQTDELEDLAIFLKLLNELEDLAIFLKLLTSLAALPTRRRNLILAYVNTLQTDELEDLAIFLKFKRPGTSDNDIASMCGVSRSTVARWDRYQAAKTRLEDSRPTRHQPSKWRASDRGGRWPLDPADDV
jgi:hypothetical protein